MTRSEELFAQACTVMPGGVSSPVRAFGRVGGAPVFATSGRGSRITDVDGRQYLDLVNSWGPLIAGYSHPAIVAAVEPVDRISTPASTRAAARSVRPVLS